MGIGLDADSLEKYSLANNLLNYVAMNLKTMDENLMYSVLSTPTFTGKEYLMVEFLAEHIQIKGYEGGIDDKGNVYLCKGKLPEGEYYPCL